MLGSTGSHGTCVAHRHCRVSGVLKAGRLNAFERGKASKMVWEVENFSRNFKATALALALALSSKTLSLIGQVWNNLP